MSRLAGEELQLVVPGSLAERWALVLALGDCDVRTELIVVVYAAALGACWPLVRSAIRWDPDIRRYGAKVIDLLLASKKGPCTLKEIYAAGQKAYQLAAANLPGGEPEVKAAEDFTPAPSGGSPDSKT